MVTHVSTAKEVIEIAGGTPLWTQVGETTPICVTKFGVGMGREGWTKPGTDETADFYFVSKQDGVTILPIFPNGDILLTIASKPRAGVIIGFPAALRRDELMQDAVREMSEETGFLGDVLMPLNPQRLLYAGLKIESGYDLVLAFIQEEAGAKNLDPGESDITLLRVPLSVVVELVLQGHIVNTEALNALLFAHLRGHLTLPQQCPASA